MRVQLARRQGPASALPAAQWFVMSSPTKGDIGPEQIPSNIYEQGPLDPSQLLEGEVELVLALECRQPLQHCGRQDGANL